MLDQRQAWLYTILHPVIYVGSLYLTSAGRAGTRGRDDVRVIKARVTATCLASLLSLGLVALILQLSLGEALVVTGILSRKPFWTRVTHLVHTATIVLSLYLGPLYVSWTKDTVEPRAREPKDRPAELSRLKSVFLTWQGRRNYIFGPLTEEIVFRGCTLPILRAADVSSTSIIWLSPLLFGLAHAHHGLELYRLLRREHPSWTRRRSCSTAAASALFHTAFTTLFGAFASVLLLRDDDLVSPLTAHVLCNWMGLPDIQAAIRACQGATGGNRLLVPLVYLFGITTFVWSLIS